MNLELERIQADAVNKLEQIKQYGAADETKYREEQRIKLSKSYLTIGRALVDRATEDLEANSVLEKLMKSVDVQLD